ncbi:phage head completion protein [Thermomonospora cellulosilytica]|uniref:Head-tail adaptor n=1 Tax=Thermomonospora cellulosilytica TaxID=1411118 RepID=A0A7W3MUC7_9ACTN|nr:head-tail adaptor protein [Thermomonospora cellulosilytica]MBA9002013.1 head-tail adaptor [Thermomonospora cellulosilytica]
MIGHLLNRELEVWRSAAVSDGSGGQTLAFALVGTVAAMVSQPTAKERLEGGQWGADHSHDIHLLAGTDVRRGDELRGGGQRFRVLATVSNSRSTYLKAPAAELTQPEGA